jgi:SNF2 family DNA or RNA helicase
MDLKREAMIILEDDMVTAPQVVTQMLRLQQVLSGHLRTDDGELIEIDNRRIDALHEVLAEVHGKVLIWSRFRYDIQTITRSLNLAYGNGSAESYFGDTSDADRQRIVDTFQDKDSNLRFFVGNPQTAGLGLTLTAANTVVYYANDFNLETRIQSEDRCHRIGQNNPVTYVDLLAEGTIDERIVKALQGKLDLSAKVLREDRKQWLELNPKR